MKQLLCDRRKHDRSKCLDCIIGLSSRLGKAGKADIRAFYDLLCCDAAELNRGGLHVWEYCNRNASVEINRTIVAIAALKPCHCSLFVA